MVLYCAHQISIFLFFPSLFGGADSGDFLTRPPPPHELRFSSRARSGRDPLGDGWSEAEWADR